MKQKTITLILLMLALILGACGPAANSDEALISIVDEFQTARNEGKWEKAASYLAEDVVWETPTGSVTGRDDWLASVGAVPGIFEEAQGHRVIGQTVFVDMIVTGPDFQSPATAEVVIEDGKIKRYTVTPP